MKKPKVGEIWFDNKKEMRFFIYKTITDTDYEVYKPLSLIHI